MSVEDQKHLMETISGRLGKPLTESVTWGWDEPVPLKKVEKAAKKLGYKIKKKGPKELMLSDSSGNTLYVFTGDGSDTSVERYAGNDVREMLEDLAFELSVEPVTL